MALLAGQFWSKNHDEKNRSRNCGGVLDFGKVLETAKVPQQLSWTVGCTSHHCKLGFMLSVENHLNFFRFE